MNKRNILFLFFVFVAYCSVYGRFYENFETVSWPDNVAWKGDRDQYKVNKGGLLQSNASGAGIFRLYRTLELDFSGQTTVWEFYVKLAFNTSASNYALFYLATDRFPSDVSYNGYCLQIGGKSDCIVLQRQDGENTVVLLEGEHGRLNRSTNALHIKVKRTQKGEWTLWTKAADESEFCSEGDVVSDTTYLKSVCLGLASVCTASRKNSFYYDEISVKQFNDDGGEEDVPDDNEDSDNTNDNEEPSTVRKYGDVVFNELMVNPKGAASLPEVEYLELYNTTEHAIDLSGWGFYYGEKGFALSAYRLEPQDYVLLMHPSKRDSFPPDWPILSVPSFPVLRNTGNLLCLLDEMGKVIHWIDYSDKWYRETSKKKGGFSLECIDPINKGNQAENWIASCDESGGTPGRINSTYMALPDTVTPHLLSVSHYTSGCLELTFSKPMDPDTLSGLTHYMCTSSPIKAIDAYPVYPRYVVLQLKMNRFFGEKIDTLRLHALTDRSGLKVPDTDLYVTQDTVWFAEKGDGLSDSSDNEANEDRPVDEKHLWLEKDYITPFSLSDDGMLKICYSFSEEGWSIVYSIYTLSGYRVDKRESGPLNTLSGILEWDGRNTSGSAMTPGIYIFYAECVHMQTGKIRRYKMPIVINRYD